VIETSEITAVPISSSALDATTGYGLQEFNTAIGFVLCVHV
jgi:hypothetical protein